MNPQDFWQLIHPPGTFAPAVASDIYTAVFADGRQLRLPIRPLPDGDHAVASLIINQASFAVLDTIAADLARQLTAVAPDIVAGLPTLGLTLAAAVAAHLGHTRYVPLGTSRKFWYRDDLSVPLSSITSPGVAKRVYIDPRMLPLLAGCRVALIDDVISSGVSMAAGIALLARCECAPVAIATAMLQSERWRTPLAGVSPDRIFAALKTPLLTRDESGCWSS
jgi:adenine/guanine phosphoribosyltransferase-like PRPP-binding protein